jgi:hypothetical protein
MQSSEIEVAATLNLDGPRGRGVVLALGKLVSVRFRDIRPCLDLLRAGPGMRWRRRSARDLHAALDRAGLTVAVEAGGRTVAKLGREARPTAMGRILQMPGIEIGWLGFGLAMLSTTRWA